MGREMHCARVMSKMPIKPSRSHLRVVDGQGWERFLREDGAPDMTLGKACELYIADIHRRRAKSRRDIESIAKRHIDAALRNLLVTDIRPAHLEAWIDWQIAQDYAPKTVRKHLSVMSGVLEHAQLLRVIESNPARQIARSKLPPQRPRDPDRAGAEVLEPWQVARLTWDERIPELRRLAWSVLLFTGVRIGELAALEWQDLSPRDGLSELVVRRHWAQKDQELRETKTGRARRVPVHPILAEVLTQAREWRHQRKLAAAGRELLVPYVTPRGFLARWNERTALRSWRKDLATVGIPEPSGGPRRLHATRHTFVSLLLRAGVSELVIARMTHPGRARGSSSSSVLLYAHEDWSSLCKAVLKYPLDQTQRESFGRQLTLEVD